MIFNIFKKPEERRELEKEELEERPKIIADIHEKNAFVIADLRKLRCDVEVKHLEVGDYMVSDIVIERKTFQDLVSSMISRRLHEQISNLKQCTNPLLIIENYDAHKTNSLAEKNINPNSIRGLLLSITLNHKIPIIFTESTEETAEYLLVLAKQRQKPMQEISMHSRIPKTKEEQKKYILEAFPGVGPATAKKLMQKFKTLSEVFNAKEEDLKEILKSKSEDFKKLLGS